jgi:hypothetical protein
MLAMQAQEERFRVYLKKKAKMEAWLARIRQRASVSPDPAL